MNNYPRHLLQGNLINDQRRQHRNLLPPPGFQQPENLLPPLGFQQPENLLGLSFPEQTQQQKNLRQQRQKRPPNLLGVLQAIKNEKTNQGTVVQQPMDLFGAPDLGLTTKHQGPHTDNLLPPDSPQGPHTDNLPPPDSPQGPDVGQTQPPQTKQQRRKRKKDKRIAQREAKKLAKINQANALIQTGSIQQIGKFLKMHETDENIKTEISSLKIKMLLETGDIQKIQNFLKDNESIEETIKQNLLKRVEDLKKERQEIHEQEATKREQQRKKQQIKKFINIIVNPNTKKQDVTNIFDKRLPLFQDIEHVDYIDDEKKRLYHQKLRQYHQKGFRDRIRRSSGNVKMLTELKQAPSDATKIEIQNLLENEKRKNTQNETKEKKRAATRLLTTGSTEKIQKFIKDNKSNEMLKQQIDKLNQKLETQEELRLLVEKVTDENKETATRLLDTGTIQEIQKFIQDNELNNNLSEQILLLRKKLAALLLQTGSNDEIRKFIKDNESKANLSGEILLLRKKLADALLQTGSNKEIQTFIQNNESNDNLSEQIQKLRKAIIKNNYKTHISNFKEAESHNNIQAIYANTVGNNQIEPSDRIKGIQNQIRLTYDIFRLSKEFHQTQDKNTKEELYNQLFGMVLNHERDPSEDPIIFNNAMMLNNENFSNFVEYFVSKFTDLDKKLSAIQLQNDKELKKEYEFICRTTQYKILVTNMIKAAEIKADANKRIDQDNKSKKMLSEQRMDQDNESNEMSSEQLPQSKRSANILLQTAGLLEMDESLYKKFLAILQRMIKAKADFMHLAFPDLNEYERLRIMNDKIFPLYFTTVEKVRETDITDIIETLKIADKPKEKKDILSFINDKYFPNVVYYCTRRDRISLSDLVTKP